MKKKIIMSIIITIGVLFIIIGALLIKQTKTTKPVEETDINQEKKFANEVMPKVSLLDINLYDKYPIEDLNKLDDVTKNKFVLDVLSTNSKEVTVNQVKEEAKKYFDNFKILKKDIAIDNLITYSYKDNKFIKGISLGNRCILRTEVISKKIENDNYIIKSKYYYMKGTKSSVEDLEATIRVYKTLKDCVDSNSEILSKKNSSIEISKEDYNKIKDNLNTYVYTASKDYKILSIKSTSN